MSTVRFVLKEPQKGIPQKDQKDTIVYLLFRYSNNRLKLSTGKKILPVYWNEREQRIKQTSSFPQHLEINAVLNEYRSIVERAYNKLLINDQIPTNEKLKAEIYKKLNIKTNPNREENLNQYIERFISEIKGGTRLTLKKRERYKEGTIKNFKGFQVQLSLYQSEKRKVLNFNDIHIDFYNDFIHFFHKKNYSTNTIGRHIKNLKTIMRAARDQGLHTNIDIEKEAFRSISVETDQIYLNENELDRLYELDLTNRASMEIARDVFLIGCYTAQRFSDYSRIKKENIRTLVNGAKVIDLIQAKGGEKVTIPMHWRLEEILKKYDYNTPKIYEQKLNERIKEVGKLAGIDEPINLEEIKGGLKVKKTVPKYELIKTHTARRSGATNMHRAKISTLDIMKITGHKTEREFLKYIRITKEETAEMLYNHEYFRPKLKVVK